MRPGPYAALKTYSGHSANKSFPGPNTERLDNFYRQWGMTKENQGVYDWEKTASVIWSPGTDWWKEHRNLEAAADLGRRFYLYPPAVLRQLVFQNMRSVLKEGGEKPF